MQRRCVSLVQFRDSGCRPRHALHGQEQIAAQPGLPSVLQTRARGRGHPGRRGEASQHQAGACAKAGQRQVAKVQEAGEASRKLTAARACIAGLTRQATAFPCHTRPLTRTSSMAKEQLLKQCGDNLTRENIVKQAANLRDFRVRPAAAEQPHRHQPDRISRGHLPSLKAASRRHPDSFCSSTTAVSSKKPIAPMPAQVECAWIWCQRERKSLNGLHQPPF